MKFTNTLLLICFSATLLAQEKEPNKWDINYDMASVTNPSYATGLAKLQQDIVNNITIPKNIKMNGGSARATVSCRVENDGKLSNIKVVEPIGYGVDKEIVAQLKNKQFTPIKHEGTASSCAIVFEVPIRK